MMINMNTTTRRINVVGCARDAKQGPRSSRSQWPGRLLAIASKKEEKKYDDQHEDHDQEDHEQLHAQEMQDKNHQDQDHNN